MRSQEHFVHSTKQFKKLRYVVSDAIGALKELERAVSADIFGRYTIESGEQLDEDNLLSFVRMAILESKNRQVDVIVVIKEPS